ncbi:hypothetical protein CK203_079884 [Vitis vinifera]|uniref:Uncharacterized protein n=1 Tax=Vitis vinifera TaxID=29760 RepID=A0A438DHY7_VITVI|nr:hypothetical protein CK203_079884 [Vitis vinifera]
MASIQEAIASLGQRIDGQQPQQVLPQDDAHYDPIVPPPPLPKDPHARMDRLEQRLRQLRTSDRAVTRDDFDGLLVPSLPTKFRMPETSDTRDWLSSHPFKALQYDHEGPWTR